MEALMFRQVLVLVMVLVVVLVVVLVLERLQQAADVTDAFGDPLPEQKLGTKSQVLGMFDETETDHSSLTGTELLLQDRDAHSSLHQQCSGMIVKHHSLGQSNCVVGLHTAKYPRMHFTTR